MRPWVVVNITIYTVVYIVCFRICVTNRAGVLGIVAGVEVAIGTRCPFSLVFSTVNGKVIYVVLTILSRHPIGVGGVANCAVVGEKRLNVDRAAGGVKIGLVTGNTGTAGGSEIAADVALGAI